MKKKLLGALALAGSSVAALAQEGASSLPAGFATNLESVKEAGLDAIDVMVPVATAISLAGLVFWGIRFVLRKIRSVG